MINLKEYFIEPGKVSLISPVESVQAPNPNGYSPHTTMNPVWMFWYVVEGHRVTVSNVDQWQVQNTREQLLRSKGIHV